ncbi:pyridoxamine 5'-phosphate oxidase family protein [Streptomyces sp. NPDC048297]|uniref:pyridoxamine 5'-phosphate oxidase family protein n=1 Tax=Streptomyces sp. NPDC048297 TaxID=3365531 RepID=UPI003714EDC5
MIRDDRPAHRRIDLDRAEALRLLGSVSLGRIVFTRQALPAVRPVRHVLDGGDIVFRVPEDTALTVPDRRDHGEDGAGGDYGDYGDYGDEVGVVVAFEADAIDPDTHLGWSVVVTGYARPVTDPGELARIRGLLGPWEQRPDADRAVRVRPDLISGMLLVRDA